MNRSSSSSTSFFLIIIIILYFLPFGSATSDYFDGDVKVEYNQYFLKSDTLDLTFNAPGTYKVEFSYTPDHATHEKPLPKNMTVVVEPGDGQIVKNLVQHALPEYLTIKITKGETSETHLFD